MQRPTLRVTSVTISAPHPLELAEFYSRLLGWETEVDGNWAQVRSPDEQPGLRSINVEVEPDYVAPTWPSVKGEQQIMTHLDIAVDDLEAAVAWAKAAGARVAEFQPQEDVRVMLDPVGHPFCLYTED